MGLHGISNLFNEVDMSIRFNGNLDTNERPCYYRVFVKWRMMPMGAYNIHGAILCGMKGIKPKTDNRRGKK